MAAPGADASETELEVLKALWEKGPSTVRDLEAVLIERGHRWAYTTIQTLLLRLQTKGLVSTKKTGLPHVYEPIVTREKLLGHRLKALAQNVCDGMAAPLVRALVSGGNFSRDEIAHFRTLLDEVDKN